MIISLSVFA